MNGISRLAAVEANLKYDLWIIAAGKGTRMGNITIPKALVEINGKSNLENTLDLVAHKFRNVFVIVSHEAEDYVNEAVHVGFNASNIKIIGIESGGGDGKAVLESFEKVSKSFDITPQAVILWGDAHLQSAEIVDEMMEKLKATATSSIIIPAILEYRPYVAINTSLTASRVNDMSVALSADFIKYGEVRDEGWHDQSIFGVTWTSISTALNEMRYAALKLDQDGNVKFTTQSGELTFLNIVHYLYNIGDPAYVYETKHPLMGYNTQAEVEKIKKAIRT
jgi:molybdopterin-guanine dinucleotide biosynthesis protein A